ASFLLGQVIVRRLLSQAKALIALLHQRDDVVRRQLVALRPGQRGSVHEAANGDYAEDRGDGGDAGDREKAASVHTIVSTRSHAARLLTSIHEGQSAVGCRRAFVQPFAERLELLLPVRGGRPRSSEW